MPASFQSLLFRIAVIVVLTASASAAVGSCPALAVDSGIANAGKSINGFLSDQYTWYDSACKPRSVALARNDTDKGGNAKQFTYMLPDGTTRTVNPGANGAAGFGYIVAHLSNPSFAWSYGADDSPLGSGNSANFSKLYAGSHHAIHEYTLNYVRYGLTQAAITNHSIDPWTWINGANDPNRQYVTAYNMPVTIHWMFATGRNYPVWSVTFDLSQAPDHAVDSDFRAPYGDMNVEGGNGADSVGGVGWGDSYKFASAGNPFTMNNDWDYSQPNAGAPYDYLWTSTVDAEMGLAGTQITAKQNAGGYNNFQAPIWRGKTSANMGQICVNDQGAGPGYDHKMPCTGDWAYQLIQYSLANAVATTDNKRLAWGADWGSLGNSSFVSSNGYAVSGWPQVSYSTFIVLDPHSANPTQAVAKQAQTASLTALTASVGTVRAQGPAGVGRGDNQTYSPAGYSPIFGTWEVDAANNAVALTFTVANTAPSTLDAPVIVVHNYTLATPPANVVFDGTALVADTDYFASVRPAQSELWVTLNKKLAGAHSVQINNAANGYALTVSNGNSAGGTVSSDVGGIACGASCSAAFAGGTAVTLTATPAAGYQFSGWGGDCGACGSATACPLTMNAAKSCAANFAAAAGSLAVYDDALGGGWQDWSWDTAANFNSTDYVHSGSHSAKVAYTAAWAGFRLEHAALCTASYASLNFWVNGGLQDGRTISVSALVSDAAQASVPLNNYIAGGSIAAGAWRLVSIPLAALGVANTCNMTGFWLQEASGGGAQPAFYVDDIALLPQPPPANVNLSVNANQVVRVVDNRWFGVNTATWDAALNTPATVSLLQASDSKVLRFPGGSTADSYHWQTNTSDGNNFQWASNFDAFASVAQQTGGQAFITVNYGSGTPQEAAGWVGYANVTKNYGFKYWEIGNENYGAWENDTQARPHDPYTYALRAKDYIAQMKAVDPTIKIGVVVIDGEDSYANYTDHPATNPRTGVAHNGWTPVVLATLKSLNVTPDFVVYHRYEQEPGNESDANLLQAAQGWKAAATGFRQQLTDYLGAAGAAVELVATEDNSVSHNPGKQTTSLVNGLFLADSLGNIMQTEFNGLVWWALRNGQEAGNNNSAALYGWRQYGDYGIVSTANDPYPTYYAIKLLAGFARGNDHVVTATSDYSLLSVYAAKRANGTLSLLVINKSPSASQTATIQLTGFTPQAKAAVTTYGIPQDEASRTGAGDPSPALSTLGNAASTFTATFAPYSLTLLSLTNAATLPTVATGAATAITPSSATLNGTVHPNNVPTTAQFEYGLTTAYGATTSVALSPNNGSTPQAVSASISGLQAGTVYHYRLTAANAQDTVAGSDAQFQTVALRLLTVNSPSGGTVGSDVGGINCGAVCSQSYANGAAVTLTATPQTGYSFAGWSGDCAGTAPTCALSMDADKTVGASFKANQTISFGAAPTVVVGGTGTVSATGGGSGNPVVFGSQTPAVCTVNGSTVTGLAGGTCTVFANQAGNANYNAAPQATQTFSIGSGVALTVGNANSAGGSVVSDVGGIACGTACLSNFASGTAVKLTAIPADGYQFTGWGGDCSTCGYGNSCALTMNAAKSCAANFEVFKKHRPLWKRALSP